MNRCGLVVVLILAVVCADAFAQNTKVLFFEAALAPDDTLLSNAPTGYSILANALRDEGMLVASMSAGTLTRKKLEPYEIVALHPSPERPLLEEEVSALVWFVAQKGGALFVHGGPSRVVNPLSEIFGISMDTSTLVDSSSLIDEAEAGSKFLLTRFPSGTGFDFKNIQTIGFYGGSPLVLSQDSVAVVTGDEDCYSDNGLYSIGSFPPVGAVSYLGRGVMVVKSDRKSLNNSNIEAFQNLQWAKALFRQLASAEETEVTREKSLLGLRARVSELGEKLKVCAEKLDKYESDLTASYGKLEKLQERADRLKEDNDTLGEQLETLRQERDTLTRTLARYRSPDTLRMVAIAAAVVLFVAMLIGFLIGRRSVRRRA